MSFWRNQVDRAKVERELDEELASYVELATEAKIHEGVDPERARSEAWAEIGGRESVKERVRERRVGSAVDAFRQDVVFAARMLARQPGFALLAATTLAIGIGATSAVFAVVDGVLLRPLPYPEAERLVFVAASARDGRHDFSPPDFLDLMETNRAFTDLGALVGRGVATLAIDGDAAPATVHEVTTSFLSIYGARPHIGRLFRADDRDVVSFEARGDASRTLPKGVVVISYELWQERFGGDAGVLGELVELDLQPYEIVGVVEPGFTALLPDAGDYRARVDVWALPRMDFARMPRDATFLRVIGRLSPRAVLAAARADAAAFAARQRDRHVLHREGDYRVEVVPLHDALTEDHRAATWVLFGAVGIVMLIVCANLTNLLLARTLARRHELAVRASLGAARGRLVRQLLTESLLYALAGLALGAPVAWWLCRAFAAMAPPTLPRVTDIELGPTVLAFGLAVALVASACVSFVPALRLASDTDARVVSSSGRGAAWTGERGSRRLLVVAEVALSMVLLIGTVLSFESLSTLLDVEAGFRPERVVTGELSLSSRRYPRYPRPDSRVRLVRTASQTLGSLPGVDAVGFALVIPLSQQDAGHTFASEEMAASSRPLPPAKYRPVTPGYFEAVGTRLLAGREFTWRELEEYRLVTLVDEKLAARAWPGESAVGKRLRIEVWSTSTGAIHLEPLWTEVIGVVENVRSTRLESEDPETVYLPYGLYAVSELSLLVRARGEPSAISESIRDAFGRVDADLALFNVREMHAFVDAAVAPERFSLDLLTYFGVTGLALALIGLYGVLSHLVGLRRRELGLRMALGANTRDVAGVVLGYGLRLVSAGIGVGLVAAAGASRLLEAQLFGVSPLDGGVYAVVAGTILAISLAACYLPARRAAKLDPVSALRGE